MKQSDKHPAPLPSPWHVFLKVLAIIFLAEVAGILLLEMVPLDRNSLAGDLADAAILIVLSAPFLWWFVIRPLRTTALAEHVRASIVVEKAIDGIITIDEKGLVESFNPAAKRIFGVTKGEMLGKPLTLLLPARFRDRHQQGLERLRSGGEPHIIGKTVELHGLRNDGSEFPMELSLARWETGEGTFYTGIVRDITERKRAEEELRASEERYRLLFENNPQPMWVYDVETLAFLAVNDAAVRHYGYSRDEFLALTIRDIRPPEDVPKLLETVSKLSPGIAKSGEWRHRKKDGTILDVEIASHDFLFDRKPARLVLANDISERKRMEETRQALYRASLHIQEQLGLQDRLNRLLESAREILHLDRFIVLLADPADRWLEAVASTGTSEPLEALRVPIGPEGGGLAQAYLTKELILWDGLTPVPEALRLQPPYDQIKAFRSRAFANVPLVVQGRAIGVLGVDRKHSRRPLEPPTLELLQLFAAQAAIAIENARLYQRERERRQQVEAVRDVGAEIARELDLARLLDLIIRRAVALVGSTGGAIHLWDEGAQALLPQAWSGHGEWMPSVRLRLGEGLAGTVAERREGLILNDYRHWPAASPLVLQHSRITAALAEPLLYRDRLVGVIVLDHEEPGRFFTERDRETLSLFAAQAAIAIENARLFDQVARAKDEWEHTFDSISDLVALIDPEYRLARVNRALAARFQTTPEALVGQPCYAILHGRDSPCEGCPHAQTMDTRQPITREVEDAHLGGTFLITASPLLQAAGQMRGCVYIARDITEFKRLEAEAWQRRRFEDLSLAKSAFIATMSHELRTPLNAVIGFSDLLREERVGPLTEKQTRYVDHIQKAGRHLLALIGDILDLSKVESGKIVLQLESLAVASLLEDVLIIARGLANQKGQEIQTEIASDLPPLIADPLRFKQICFNLLSNAVKFTPDGGRITVRARRVPGIADFKLQIADLKDERPPLQSAIENLQSEIPGDFLEIAVKDTGIGIKAEDLPRLFREFVQLEATRAQKQEGTGLGLALTKNLVELHGGRIWAESGGEGQGATFTVRLPCGGPRA